MFVKMEKKFENRVEIPCGRNLNGSENGKLEEVGKELGKNNKIMKKNPLSETLRGFLGC